MNRHSQPRPFAKACRMILWLALGGLSLGTGLADQKLARAGRGPAPLAPLGAHGEEVPLRRADGVLAIPVTLLNQEGDRDVITLEVALNFTGTVELHPDVIQWLGAPEPEPGTPGVAVPFVLNDQRAMALNAGDIEVTDEATFYRQNRFTVRNAEALQDRPLKGRIGLGFFKHYNFVINAAEKTLKLAPRAKGARAGETGYGIQVPFALAEDRIALLLQAEEASAVILGSSAFENRIASWHPAVAQGRPGLLNRLVLSSKPTFDLARGFAWRPVEWPRGPVSIGVPRPVAVTGTDFLLDFEVAVDWDRMRVSLRPTRDRTDVPADHLAFFLAEKQGSAEALEDYLSTYPNGAFALEAATRLLEQTRENADASPAAFMKALRWLAETTPAKRRLEACLPTVSDLAKDPRQAQLTIAAGELALSYAQASESVQQIYRIHRMVGIARFQCGDFDGAWRHLMSAAFVKTDADPDHLFLCSFYLGRLYESQGRLGRAYSRYQSALRVKAAKWEPPEELRHYAEQALLRLRERIPPTQLEELDAL